MTTPVATRAGSVYLTSPITGEVREVDPDTAAELIQGGWAPASEQTGEAARAAQIPREQVAAEGSLGKLGYGVARGVGTPLVDLALPAGNRVNELLMEDSPWLTGGGEALGMVGAALVGAGPVAALENASAKVATGLGAGNGLLRSAFARGAAGALEGGAYGAMTAVSQAHNENVPLTAQRFGSEILPGLIFGGLIGGGLGAFEGVGRRALPARIVENEKAKLDEIFRAGVSDEDALRIAQREFGVKDPSALHAFQAAASGGDATPALHALANDSGPVGERIRRDLFFNDDMLNEAERRIVDVGGEFLVAREEAMRQIQTDLKRGHIEQLVGSGEAAPADVVKLIREHVSDVHGAPTIAGRDFRNSSYTRGLGVGEHALPEYPNIDNYVGSSAGMNGYLREVAQNARLRDPKLDKRVQDLVDEVNAVRDAGGAYRGDVFRGEVADPAMFKTGEVMDFPSFMSASRDLGTAEGFAGKEGVIFRVRNADGVPLPGNRDEFEILLEPQKFRVVSNDGRNVVLEPLVARTPDPKLAQREAFIDKVLDHVDDSVLKRELGASDNLRERLIAGLAKNHNETIQALEKAMVGAKLSDDALRGFGERGIWTAKPQDFFNKWKSAVEMFDGVPKGVNDAASDFKKLLGNLEFREQAAFAGNRANAAAELDTLKKRLANFAKPGERLGPGDQVAAVARDMYEDLRQLLEDPGVWGTKFAEKQQKINAVLHRSLGVGKEFDDAFVKEIGLPDPDSRGWRNARVIDSGKVNKSLKEMSEPKQLEQLNRLRDYLDDQKKFFKEVLGMKLTPTSEVRIKSALKHIDSFRESLDKGVYLNARAKQARGLLGFGPLGSGWEARAALGAVVGGPVGAVAGLGISAALNPGKMLQFRAIAERMAESTGSRVWQGVSKLLGLKVGDVARQGANFIGRGAKHSGKVGKLVTLMLRERGDERAETYRETVRQLVEARDKLGELDSHLDERLPMLEQALPGTKAQLMKQSQMALDYVLNHLPVTPQMRLYGERAAPLNDQDYENFIRMAVAATDPASIIEMAEEGELTPQAVAAAEYTAPDFVGYMRSEMVRAITDHGPRIAYEKRISASLLMGTALDESLEPENVALQQQVHLARMQRMAQQMGSGGKSGTGKETGVNQKYQSESDRLESGVPPQ